MRAVPVLWGYADLYNYFVSFMEKLIVIITSLCLCGCAVMTNDRKAQMEEAIAYANRIGDNRPYPSGWPVDALPHNGDPSIVKYIQLGQTTSEVASIMGREAAYLGSMSREKFILNLNEYYKIPSLKDTIPSTPQEVAVGIAEKGQFIQWIYQGFPTTAQWIVIGFASPINSPEEDPIVIFRGIFELGCL